MSLVQYLTRTNLIWHNGAFDPGVQPCCDQVLFLQCILQNNQYKLREVSNTVAETTRKTYSKDTPGQRDKDKPGKLFLLTSKPCQVLTRLSLSSPPFVCLISTSFGGGWCYSACIVCLCLCLKVPAAHNVVLSRIF